MLFRSGEINVADNNAIAESFWRFVFCIGVTSLIVYAFASSDAIITKITIKLLFVKIEKLSCVNQVGNSNNSNNNIPLAVFLRRVF